MFCLPEQFSNKILNAVKSGELTFDKINSMSSQEMRDYLTNLVGAENAQQVNLLFEKKLLLKNKEAGIIRSIKDMTGLSTKQKNALLEKLKKNKDEAERRLLDPQEEEKYLNELSSDIYARKYRTEVSLEEAQKITELTNDAKNKFEALKSVLNENNEYTDKSKKNTLGIEFGAAKRALDNYVSALKADAKKRTLINPLKQEGVGNKISAIIEDARISTNFILQNTRTLLTSFFDNSFFGRQGRKAATRPVFFKSWKTQIVQSIRDGFKVLLSRKGASDEILDAVTAEIYSRESYLKGYYDGKGLTSKLDIGIKEEETTTPFAEKIPVLGRFFSSARVMYEGGSMRLRADIADVLYNIAEKEQQTRTGNKELSKEIISGANLVTNSMTGRGSLGKAEGFGGFFNTFIFAPKWIKSQIDTATHPFGFDVAGKKVTPLARKQATKNLASLVISSAVILMIAKMIDDDSVELNSTSSDFGKIKIGNTRIDVTGGFASYAVLGARLLNSVFGGSYKSAITGVEYKYGEGFGSQTGKDVLFDWLSGKASPVFGTILQLLNQRTYSGGKPTAWTVLQGLGVPIVAQSAISAHKEGQYSSEVLLTVLGEFFGLGTTTFEYDAQWDTKTTKEMIQFKEKLGDDKLNEANDRFNQVYNEWIVSNIDTEWYKNLTNEQKKDKITKVKEDIKQRVFKEYGFKYKSK